MPPDLIGVLTAAIGVGLLCLGLLQGGKPFGPLQEPRCSRAGCPPFWSYPRSRSRIQIGNASGDT
jgi:hypothetical protein